MLSKTPQLTQLLNTFWNLHFFIISIAIHKQHVIVDPNRILPLSYVSLRLLLRLLNQCVLRQRRWVFIVYLVPNQLRRQSTALPDAFYLLAIR